MFEVHPEEFPSGRIFVSLSSSSFLKCIFAGYRILGWQLFYLLERICPKLTHLFFGEEGYTEWGLVHEHYWRIGCITPLTTLGLLVVLHRYWRFFRLPFKLLWPMKQIRAICILTAVCFLLQKPLNNGLIVKVSDRSSILPTIHSIWYCCLGKIFSKFDSKSFLTVPSSPPLSLHPLVKEFGHWVRLFPERDHFLLSASWLMIRIKIWTSALTIPGSDTSLFFQMVALKSWYDCVYNNLKIMQINY